MEAISTTIPAPAQRGRFTKIAAIATAVTALALVVAGTVALAANAWRDSNGYFNWPTKTFTSSGYAIAMKTVDISHAPQWVFSEAGLDSVRVKAQSDRPIFIGIARTADLERYLRGTEHDDVSGLTYNPFQASYDHTSGHAPQRAPTKESIWVKSTSGTGNVALAWHPRPGSWRAVLMNADGSRGVTAQLQLGARTSLLWWLGGGLLAAAVLAATAAAALLARARTLR
jgi:hypothetical protein